MEGDTRDRSTVQLDIEEREQLESVVVEMRDRVESNVEYRLARRGLDEAPDDPGTLDAEAEQLVEAIQLEADDDIDWDEAVAEYVTGVGYTIVNRLAALRCMEVRGFVDEAVTVVKSNGLTPAAETLVHEAFLMEDEALLAAYHEACDELADEIELLFDRSSAYSLLDPDADTFEALCGMLDDVPEAVWRADDVLGWVYEYYNTSQLSAVRERMRTGQFDAEDVAVANQFYTPHWVARLLTDNAVGKPHLQATGGFEQCVERQRSLTPAQRVERDPSVSSSPSLTELCTYTVPSADGDGGVSQHPSELRILDPACGSGHFLLYAFDVLERIWRDATDVHPAEIPEKILEHNLYGIDIDMRACQLAAFNLYLKARQRAEREGNDSFRMPSVDIVCADNHLADIDEAYELIETLGDANSDFATALEGILEDFRTKPGLGSLLDVRGTLEAEAASEQTALSDWTAEIPSLSGWIDRLHREIEQEESAQFLYHNLRSFLRVVRLLTEEYDAVLMNPPYGGHRRMPPQVKAYVQDHYEFKPEYYANFLEQAGRLLKPTGRIGMLVPRSFMYKESFEDVREALIDHDGAFDFDFLLEFGAGILDNATVRTVGTVLTAGETQQTVGEFVQLSDADPSEKEETFARVLDDDSTAQWRRHSVRIDDFRRIPGGMLTYWTPDDLRDLYTHDTVFDAEQAGLDRAGIGAAKKGIDTGNNDRFVRKAWECDADDRWRPYAKGGERSWFYYPDRLRVLWGDGGREITRYGSSTIRNRDFQGEAAVTWPLIKDSGHRFAQFGNGGISDNGGPCFYPESASIPYLTALLNSRVYTGLMLAQTPERQWNLSDIAILPFFDISAAPKSRLVDAATRLSDLVERLEGFQLRYGRYGETLDHYESLDDFVTRRTETVERTLEEMRRTKSTIDTIVARELGVDDETLDRIDREAALRYGETFEPIPYGFDDVATGRRSVCERLLSHLVLAVVRESDDGIVEVSAEFADGTQLHDGIERRLDDLFDAPASSVLAAIDGTLGSRSAEAEPYPNVRYWVRNAFFEAHLAAFENTPVVWRLTTAGLVPDPAEEGFGCLVDYRSIDTALFDRLETQYLEPRKAALREQRTSADRRRNDGTLTATARADAAESYDRAVSSLQQIEQFETTIQDLLSDSPRQWTDDDRERADALGAAVREFRTQTQDYLDLVETLVDRTDDAWIAETFSPTFLETVEDNRSEWIDTLDSLERACEAYASPADEPVAARHYDLFRYFPDAVGSDHYASNGILFMTYYFEREGEQYLDADGDPRTDGSEVERILATLASGLDQYKRLADEIESGCGALAAALPSTWKERAVTEITTEGYRPNPKHGVAINVRPLVDAGIVPDSVADRVL